MACNPDNIINLKTGSSGTFVMQVTEKGVGIDDNEVDVPKDITGYTIFIDFLSPISNELLFAASIDNGITFTGEIGQYTVEVGSTWDWPVGLMPLDILYVYNGTQQHTDDWALDITEGRTRGV